jgi:hypothetical protein
MSVTLDFLIQYQESVVDAIKENKSVKNLHVEEQILRVLNEVRKQEHQKQNGLVIVEMSHERYKKISEIY